MRWIFGNLGIQGRVASYGDERLVQPRQGLRGELEDDV